MGFSVSWSNQPKTSFPKQLKVEYLQPPFFPFFQPTTVHPVTAIPSSAHILKALCDLENHFFLLLRFPGYRIFLPSSSEVIPRLPLPLPPHPQHASVMFLCRCRGSRPEARPADGAEPPAGRGGTSRGALRGKKKKNEKAPENGGLSSLPPLRPCSESFITSGSAVVDDS